MKKPHQMAINFAAYDFFCTLAELLVIIAIIQQAPAYET